MKQQNPKGGVFVFVIIILALVGLVFWMVKDKGDQSSSSGAQTSANPTKSNKSVKLTKSAWQAVILASSDQFYVGKVEDINDPFVVVKETYVVRTSSEDGKALLNVFRVSEGAHGPTNDIRVSRDAILLIEDLREDSDVVKLIQNYDAQKAAQSTPEAKK